MTNAVAAAVAIVALVLLALRSLWTNNNRILAEDYSNPCGSSARLVFGFREICRTVLVENVVTFLTANAPAGVISSFRARQHQLAQFSLRVASHTLCQRLIGKNGRNSQSSFQRNVENLFSRVQSGILLLVCGLGRASLWLMRSLSYAIPRRAQLWVPAKVLSGVAGMLGYLAPDETSEVGLADCESDILTENLVADRKRGESLVVDDIRTALSAALPSDLSRMICLATLRDNNTGGYFHPELARRFTIEASDRAMLVCHQELYEHLVSLALDDFTDQLDAYFASTHASKARSIEYWKKLRAYRATIPIGADPISAEILFMKVEVALAILEARASSKV